MEQYLELMRRVLDQGARKDDRTGTGTLSVFGHQLRFGLEDGFLATEYRKALQSRLSPPCGKVAGMFVHHTNLQDSVADKRKLVCYDCGVACDLSAMRGERLVYLKKLGADGPVPIDLEKRKPKRPEERRHAASSIRGTCRATQYVPDVDVPSTTARVLERPRRVAPAAIIASASSRVRMPPDAFTSRRSPTVCFISSTACTLAPPEGWNPVDVLTKSAPARSAACETATIA